MTKKEESAHVVGEPTGSENPSEKQPDPATSSPEKTGGDKETTKDESAEVQSATAKEENPELSKDEPTLEKFFEDNPTNKPLEKKDLFTLKEGDFEESDGKFIIRAKHLEDDIKTFIQDPSEFQKIKNNKAKASFMAKAFGFKLPNGDADVDGMSSAVRKYLTARDEDATKVLTEHFPKWLYSEDEESPFSFQEPVKHKSSSEEKMSKDIPYTQAEISDAISGFAESKNIDPKEVWQDAKFFENLKMNKYNPATGELRSPRDLVSVAGEGIFKKEPPSDKAKPALGNLRGVNPDKSKESAGGRKILRSSRPTSWVNKKNG